jgi:hypothetical protein
MKTPLNAVLENFKLFFEGALDMKGRSVSMIESEAKDEMDQFLLLCFGDFLGIDLPTNYYALEFLPYLAEELEVWRFGMNDKKSIWEAKGAMMDMDP